MEILDAQIHAWLTDRPSRPWIPEYRENYRERLSLLIHAGQSVSLETALTEMAEAGVDGGSLSPVGVYGTDNTFELSAARRFPRKFTVVGWIDHEAPDVAERLQRDVSEGMRGVRIMRLQDRERIERREFEAVLTACQEIGCAVSLMLTYPIHDGIEDLVQRYDGINFIIDHLGIGLAPPTLGPPGPDPFERLPPVLALAAHPNAHMKLTGAPSVSNERYPFHDVWDGVRRIVDAFGPERVMWGSDFTRTSGLHSYWDGTHYLAEIDGFTDAELELIYGQSLRRVLGWSADPHVKGRPEPGLA